MVTRLLIAESDESMRGLFARYFHGIGYEVKSVSTAAETLAQIQSFEPQILVVDDGLWWGDGQGVLDLANRDHLDTLPVIITSTTRYPRPAGRVLGCLVKPFRMTQLLAMVQTAEAALTGPVRKPAATKRLVGARNAW